eukprot:786085_1
MAEYDLDLEDEQFKRAREDTADFPHYELTSTHPPKQSDDLFVTNYDDDDHTGEFPFDIDHKSNQNHPDESNDAFETIDLSEPIHDDGDTPNPLYVHNYWRRYHSLALHWPNCDGKCGNKLGRLIHNVLYGSKKQTDNDHPYQYYDAYQLNSEDITAIKAFANINPLQLQADGVIQMWSFIDSLRVRVEEHNKNIQESKLHELIAKDIESTLNVKEIISKHLLCYSTPIRRYLISLLRCLEDSPDSYYYGLLKSLKDKENIICDDGKILSVWSQLISFKETQHYFVLYQLSRYSCIHHSDTIFQELKRNGFYTISPNLYTKDMLRIINTKEYRLMSKYNLELTAEEIISVLIYTGADQISRRVRESLIMEQRSCKWMHLTANLVSGVEKMHKTLVQTQSMHDLPDKLYYAVGSSIDQTIKYFDVISTTANKKLALKFMKRGTMIIFEQTNEMLHSSRFVAAPLNWITARKNNAFSEWLVTCIRIHDMVQNKSDDGNYTITCTDYETIGFRSMGTWRKVVDASMILDEPNQAFLYATNAAILNVSTWECLHCNCVSPCYCYQGSVLMDNMECCYCRRYNLFAFNVPERIVSCFECKQESMLKEYHIQEDGQGTRCPKCNVFQSIAFRKSEQFEKMRKYLSVNSGFKKREQKKTRNVNDNVSKTVVIKPSERKTTKSGALFRWGKKPKSVKSSNLNDIAENTSIVEEDDFD